MICLSCLDEFTKRAKKECQYAILSMIRPFNRNYYAYESDPFHCQHSNCHEIFMGHFGDVCTGCWHAVCREHITTNTAQLGKIWSDVSDLFVVPHARS